MALIRVSPAWIFALLLFLIREIIIKVFKVHIHGPGIEVKLFIDIVISFPCTWY